MSTTKKDTDAQKGAAQNDKADKSTGSAGTKGRSSDGADKGAQADAGKGARAEKDAPAKGSRTNESKEQPDKKR